jgi:succinate dehydrogenase hydrophobic anchor subunit
LATQGLRKDDCLVFVLAHSINGLREVVLDFISKKHIRLVNQASFVYWLVMMLFGATALVGGVRQP